MVASGYSVAQVFRKRADIHAAFLSLGCTLIRWQSLRRVWITC
jgi:hypothetical protein